MQTLTVRGFVTAITAEDTTNIKYTKRTVVLCVDREETIPFVFTNENIRQINELNLNVGDTCHITFSLRGWEYNNKFYSSLEGLSITK